MTDLNVLKDFVPGDITVEAGELVDYLKQEGIGTVEVLAQMSSADIVLMWDRKKPALFFGAFFNQISAESSDLLQNYIIGDIDDPQTARAKSRVDQIWKVLRGRVGKRRTSFFDLLIDEFLATFPLTSPRNSFQYFAEITQSEFESHFTEDFKTAFATYYIGIAKEYLRTYRSVLTLYARITDQNGNPIRNVQIVALDRLGGTTIGYGTYTNHEGLFSYEFSTTERILDARFNKKHFFKAKKVGLKEKDFEVEYEYADADHITTVILETAGVESTLLSNIFSEGQLENELKSLLQNNIGSDYSTLKFSDLRAHGLLRNQKGQNFSGLAKVQMDKLDALAIFELVSRDSDVAEAIYDDQSKGYKSPFEVAAVPRKRFIKEHFEKFTDGRYGAAMFHEKSVKQAMYATTRFAQTRDDLTPPINRDESGNPILPELDTADKCGCDDCKSAVGPQAYLADLLSFISSNLTETTNGQTVPIDSDWIRDRLFQDMGSIPAECHQLEKTVCQTRIATEVLVAKSGQNSNETLDAAKIEYIETAYRNLLIGLGTTYEELRRFQTVTDEAQRKSYANRLGIVLKYTDENDEIQETVDVLYKDLSALTPQDEESLLYKVFGLVPTFPTNPVDESNWLQKWKRFRLRELWEERDYFNDTFFLKQKPIIDPDIVTVDDFRHPDDAQANMKAFEIWVNRRRYIDAHFKALYDRSVDDTNGQNTLIDAFGLMEQSVYNYTTINNASKNPGSIWSANSFNNLTDILNQIDNGSETEETLWENYYLKVGELRRLLELSLLDQAEEPISSDDRHEAINLFLVAMKREFTFPRNNGVIWWVQEEEINDVQLSAIEFWISENEPKEGSWPIYQHKTPLIDPQIITAAGLPEITFRKEQPINSLDIFESRLSDLDEYRNEILQNPEINIKEKINISFHHSGYTYDNDPAGSVGVLIELRNQLDDPATSGEAQVIIRDVLLLTTEDFLFVMDSAAEYLSAGKISNADTERMNSVLTYVRKVHSFYPGYTAYDDFPTYIGWFTEESGFDYWKARKARLPKWRSSVAERTEWKNALIDHNKRPIIDPDLIGPAYLRNPAIDDPAFHLWRMRYSLVHGSQGIYAQIAGESFDSDQTLPAYNGLLKKYLFALSKVTIDDLKERKDAGDDISDMLEQLQISSSELNFLLDVHRYIQIGSGLSTDQKKHLYFLLTKVQKKRLYYSQRLEELNVAVNGVSYTITRSPDYFVDRAEDYSVYPPNLPYELNPYLASTQDLSEWRRIVVARKEEEENILRALDEILMESDDENMPFLRNAYIDYFPVDGNNLTEKSRNLGDELLIDLQNDCCTKTNKVAQAIETLQQLIWKAHTNDILSHYPGMELHLEDFDSVWQWIGSYANWRASMFAFLYPENILLPSLRSNFTPGFKTVLENTQNNRRFNPSDACRIALDYRNYLSDIKDLEVKCSVEVNMITQSKDDCAGLSQIRENLTFVFATAENSGKSYYSSVSSTEFAHHQKLNWASIGNLPTNAIIKGCDVYISRTYKVNHVYLFYILPEIGEEPNFYALRFNLNDNRWEEEPIQIQLEKGTFRVFRSFHNMPFDAPAGIDENVELDILELAVCMNTHSWQAPVLAVSLRSSYSPDPIPTDSESEQNYKEVVLTFTRSLDANGKELDHNDSIWRSYVMTVISASNYNILDRHSSTGYVKQFAFRQGASPLNPPPPANAEIIPWHGYNYYLYLTDYKDVDDIEASTFMEKVVVNKRDHNLRLILREIYFNETAYLSLFQVVLLMPSPDKSEILFVHKFGHELKYIPIEAISSQGLAASKSLFLNPATRIIPQQIQGGLNPDVVTLITQNALNRNEIQVTQFQYDHNSESIMWAEDFFPIQPRLSQIPGMNASIGSPKRQMLRSAVEIAVVENIGSVNPRVYDFIEEAYFFIPVEIGLRLSHNGYFEEALDWFRLVYDFYAPHGERKIYYGLVLEENLENLEDRMEDWYRDPFNPHAIAQTRQSAYTRFVLISIANCLLPYANSEFTFDNSESVPRARELYEDMTDLLSVLAPSNPCKIDEAIRDLSIYINNDVQWYYLWKNLLRNLDNVHTSQDEFQSLTSEIESEMANYPSDLDDTNMTDRSEIFKNVENLINDAMNQVVPKMDEVLGTFQDVLLSMEGTVIPGDRDTSYERAGQLGAKALSNAITAFTGFESAALGTQDMEWLVEDVPAEVSKERKPKPMDYSRGGQNDRYTSYHPEEATLLNNPFPQIRISGMSFMFCVTPNPIVAGLRMAAEGNLFKIHNCMNIAGMKRELSPFAAPTDATSGIPSIGVGGSVQFPGQLSVSPSNFRFGYLIDRTKQLVILAQQMESSFLQYLERYDAEQFSQLKARQDLEMAKSNIKLQDLKLKEAESNIKLAELQRERSEIQVAGLQDMLDTGLLAAENDLISGYLELGALQNVMAQLDAMQSITGFLLNATAAGGGFSAGAQMAASHAIAAVAAEFTFSKSFVSMQMAGVQTSLSINSILASLQRREQEWTYQKSLADQDVKIGGQQIKVANDRKRIVGQEREMASLQMTHAEATLDFLKTKFTNAELYEWMSGVLEDVYSYFLQEATAMAKLAEQQLSFERQTNLPNLIKSDYWSVNSGPVSFSIGGGEADRRGLTGSARLMRDVTELEQYAMDTTPRKLQISKTLSLNEFDPVQMEIFRQTGVYNFSLTNGEFDKDYPGHYLRLIRKVSVSVIALVPPNKGIKATLTNSGISSVVTGEVIFQTKNIARMPERVALSSPYNASGIFDLHSDQNQYLPFEGCGVESSWELRMEKPANPFDFRFIADVLISIEYEAMHSEIYANIIKGELNSKAPERSIVLSLKHDLPDTWYDIQNGLGAEGGFASEFKITESDLTPHDTNPLISGCKIFLSHAIGEGEDFSFGSDGNLALSLNGTQAGGIDLNSFLVNPGNALEITGFNEMSPLGDWSVQLTNSMGVRQLMEQDKLNDILIIINYTVNPIPFAQ